MGFFDKLKKITTNLFSGFSEADEAFFEELEETLILADLGMDTALDAVEKLRTRVRKEKLQDQEAVKAALRDILAEEMDVGGTELDLSTRPAVVLFIGVYYGLSGLIADLMLCFTMLIVMAGMGAFGATLTLPGIAGIVLTIGMAVDANVLIYERIREELRLGLTPLAAVRAGFDRAAISITDSNLTSIIVTIILYQFGTGPIRGFAVTLGLGIMASMFTAIFVSRAIFEEWARHCGPKGISI